MPTRTTYLVGLALLLAGCCCPGGSEPYGPQPSGLAVLRVETVPPAEVWVDGTSVGMAPLETTVAAGTIVVDVRLGGFVEHRAEVTLGPGAEVSERYVLRAADVEDREVLQMLADAHELWVEPLPEPATDRGDAATSPAQLVYPRGELRASDLAEFRIDFGADAPPKGWVRFAKGGKPFYEKTFETPDTGVLIRSLPADVQTNLKAGDKVTWGYYPEEGEAVTGTFDVVDKDVSAVVAAMKKGLAGQPPAVVSQLVAQVYSDAGLHYAAHQLASRTIRGGHAALRPWAVVLNSLERMGAPKAARAFGEARKQVAAFSALQGREVYARPDYPVQRVLEHLDTGQAGRALLSLRKEGVATIAQSPQQVRMVAERAAAQSRFLAARSPAATAKVADAVVAMAKAAQEQAPDDPQTAIALSYAMLHAARVAGTLEKADPEAWRSAVEELLTAYDVGLEDEGRAMALAVGWLREAAPFAGSKGKAFVEAAVALADRCAERFPKSPYAAMSQASAALASADRGQRTAARKSLQKAADALAPHLDEAGVDPLLADVHTQAVTLDRVRKLRMDMDYRTKRHDTVDFLLQFEVPDSPRWKVAEPPPEGFIARIDEYGPQGDLIRVVTVRSAASGVGYLFAGGSQVDGENVGQLARVDLEEASRGFRDVKGRPRALKKRFSRAFLPGYGYELRGTGPDGAYRRLRSWFVKSRERRVTFLIGVTDFVDLGRKDGPEILHLMQSIKEAEKKTR